MILRRYYVALYTQLKFPKISILLHLIFLIIDNLAVEYFVDKPSGSKEQNLSNKEDIVNAFLFSKRSWCKMSKNFLNAISCSDSFFYCRVIINQLLTLFVPQVSWKQTQVFRGRSFFRRCPWYAGRSDSSWCCEGITWLFTRRSVPVVKL
jgi:hypothetical protein